MTLHLHAFQPDLGRLMRLAARERLLPNGDDPGYAVHAVLAATFGDLAPAPWALLAPGEGGGPRGRLLAYSPHPLGALLAHASAYADPTFAGVLDLPSTASKVMPDRFPSGTRLGFRARLRPVSRLGKPLAGHASAAERGARGQERDVYLARVAAAERAMAASGGTPNGMLPDAPDVTAATPVPSRAACYLEWLDGRLRSAGAELAPVAGGAAETWAAHVEAFRFTRLLARDRGGPRAQSAAIDGPDALMTGTLVVTDPDAFTVGLARGVGRHRAFGFGMLLLTPPRD
ncbi:hypothetical protein tb265_49190 [Gemmatimonadetes bacterium T265]|nr:hypothetical protein tb265_49190 [Gemmatimonadetes bacterium T265]